MPTSESISAELFESHAAFVRRLARAMVRDEASALDLEQETWCAVVAKPPAQLDRVRGWLALVVRRIASRQRREHEARRQRECVAARAERVERGPVDTIEALVAALQSLREPLRTTLVRRYFEDLAPREIARAEGVPIETVKSRLKRGLRELRRRLDERLGDGDHERCSLALLAAFGDGIARPATATTVTADATAKTATESSNLVATGTKPVWRTMMTTQPKVAIVIALVPAAFWYFSQTTFDDAPAAPSTVASLAEDAGLERMFGFASTTSVERTEVADAGRPTATDFVAPAEFAIELLVEDRDGLPLSHVLVHGAPVGHPFNVLGTTGADGRFACRWSGRGDSQVLHLKLFRSGTDLVGLRTIRISAGEASRLHFVTTEAIVAESPTASLGSSRDRAQSATAERTDSAESLQGVRRMVREFGAPQGFVVPRQGPTLACARELGDGRIEFCAHQPAVAAGREVGPSARELTALLEALERRGELDPSPSSVADSKPTRLAGQIVDAGGVPAEGVLVAAHSQDSGGALLTATRTDRDGRYAFAVRRGPIEVRVGALIREFDDVGDEQVTCDLQIELGTVLIGGVSFADGTPIDSAIVEARGRDADGVDWIARAVTRADGQFRIPNCPVTSVDLDVYAADLVPALPIARTRGARVDAACRIFVDAAALARAPVTFGIDDAAAPGAVAGEIRIFDENRRVGAAVAAHGARGSAQQIELPRGVWKLEVIARDPRALSLGAVHVADQPIELGACEFERSATLAIDTAGEPLEGFELDVLLHRDDVDTWVVWHQPLTARAGAAAELELPAGDYTITLRRVRAASDSTNASDEVRHRVRLESGQRRLLLL